MVVYSLPVLFYASFHWREHVNGVINNAIYTRSVFIMLDSVRFIGKILKRWKFQLEAHINFRNFVVAPLKDSFRLKFTFENAFFPMMGIVGSKINVAVRVVFLGCYCVCFYFLLEVLRRDDVYLCMNYLNSWKSRTWYRTEYYITQLQRKLCPKICILVSFLSKLCTMLFDAWRNQVTW